MIDLYSDAKSLPSAGMRAAMAEASVGDEQADEDPTTLLLCRRVAEMLGMEAGLFLPSGTMCNLVAILVHTRPGDEIIVDDQSHIYCTEAASAAAVGGVATWAIPTEHGIFSAGQLRGALRPRQRMAPRSALVSIEQTTNFAGGAVWELDQLDAIRDTAHEAGLKCHMDGARLFNACAATDIAAHRYAAGWDSAWIDLTKGLGCPVGAVLCGSTGFVRDAWQWKYRLGGAMRQSGILAAAGLYALRENLPLLKADHRNAHAIWELLSASERFRFDPAQPRTNILRFALADDRLPAPAFVRACLDAGVRVRAIERNHVRVTTHLGVSANEAAEAARIMLEVARQQEEAL